MNLWEKILFSWRKLSIKILTKHTSSIITYKNSIWIEHRDNFYAYVIGNAPFSDTIIFENFTNEPFKDPWTRCFTRMCPTIYD